MKRVVILVLCVVLMGTMVLQVSASSYMGLSASAPTVYRGDSFSIYVSLSNDQVIGRGGIVLNYDSSVFEFVGGSCNVSGATLAEVSAGRNGGVFALAENRVVSGTIFTIQMRVKSNAPFGGYTISGTASMDVACSAGSTAVTVACKHTYGNFEKIDSTTHKRICSVCKAEEKSAHTWNSGTVKQAATCIATGIRVFTCTGCGLTREEGIPVSSTHSFTGWKRVDGSSHKGVCSVCGAEGTAAHTWNSGTVTKAATCTQTGLADLQCTACAEEKTEVIPMTEHTYTAFEKVDDEKHTHTCTGCGKEEVLSHSYSNKYGHNVNEHYLLCDGCGHTKDPAVHTPGPEATYETPQTCVACGRVLKPAGNHVHNFADTWSMDLEGHWYACDSCDEQSGLKFHVYSSDCDESCDVCGYERIPPHSFSDILSADESGHWYPCSGCDEKKGFSAHIPGEEASIRSNQSCMECGYELAPRVDHPHEFDTVHSGHYHECVCGERTEVTDEESCEICAGDIARRLGRFPWWILCIVEAVVIAVLVLLPVIQKKKGKIIKQ